MEILGKLPLRYKKINPAFYGQGSIKNLVVVKYLTKRACSRAWSALTSD